MYSWDLLILHTRPLGVDIASLILLMCLRGFVYLPGKADSGSLHDWTFMHAVSVKGSCMCLVIGMFVWQKNNRAEVLVCGVIGEESG